MMTPQLMAIMDDDHLATALRAEFDPLTSTPAELELLKRMERLLGEQAAALADAEQRIQMLENEVERLERSQSDESALLALLNDEDIHETEQLEALIARANEFKAIANDAGDVLARLSQLITTAQE